MSLIVTVTPNPALDRTMTISEFEFDEMIRAQTVRLDWSGKGFNVSRALLALGLENVGMGFLGGATGRMIEQGLRAEGLTVDATPVTGETRTNVTITDAAASRYIKVNETGPTVSAQALDVFFEQASARANAGDIWVLAGSLPPGAPPNFYATLIALLTDAGARAVLDTSGVALRAGMAAKPFAVKPNLLEAAEIMGRPLEDKQARLDAVGFFLDQGVALAALSLGADGLLLGTQTQTVWARPPQLQVRNPVGAGDGLVAGLVWALTQELAAAEIARWGVACGTAAALQEGTGYGSADDVRALASEVQVEVLRSRV